ncbi:hypothetical protein BTUL_0001g02020 [Botrytis tulipae]|uniref:Uncharacterized protein n=1 Tax=Botrytis tulipae TaxID=87230 RepID=A0A4Z1F9C4_9HELO|nr:hypothetical protein BTUL_0001g02020 [Botrytis tulipae]
MSKNPRPNPSKREPQTPHYHPQYNWRPHWALDSQSQSIATRQYNKTWNSRHTYLARRYPDAPAYGPFLVYITDKSLWRERDFGIDGGFVEGKCVGNVDSVDVIADVWCRGKNLGSFVAREWVGVRKERDVELGVDEEIGDPDIPIASIETDEETCLPGINTGPGKEDTTKLGEMVLDPDIPIPSIELDGDECMEEEEPEGRLVELQSGKDERRVVEEESSDIFEARARDSHGTRCQERTKLGRNHQQHLLTTSRGQICLREAVLSINIT